MRVLVQASDNLLRVAATALLTSEPDLMVINAAGAAARPMTDGTFEPFDVVVCGECDVSGVLAAPTAAAVRPPIVALLPEPTHDVVGKALRSGAAGLHCVTCHLLELPTAVRAIGHGAQAWFAPCVAASIAAHLSGRGTPADDHGLTPREALILKLMASGATNADTELASASPRDLAPHFGPTIGLRSRPPTPGSFVGRASNATNRRPAEPTSANSIVAA